MTSETLQRTQLGPSQNPRRALARHRERGPKRYAYTVRDVAAAAGVSVNTARRYLAGKMGDLAAVAGFIAERRGAVGESSTEAT